MRRAALTLSLAVLAPAFEAAAQARPVTLEDVFHPERKLDFAGSPPAYGRELIVVAR